MNEPEKTVSPEAAARLQRMFENIYSQTPYFQSMPCTVEKLDVGRVRVGFDIGRHSCNYRGIASGGVLRYPHGYGQPDPGLPGDDAGNQYELYPQRQRR